jgi:aspartokinase/homoserine dehydrogenase 1
MSGDCRVHVEAQAPAGEPRRIGVALAGASGRVGRAFAALLAARTDALRTRGLDLPLVGVARSRGWRWDAAGLAHSGPHDGFAGAAAGSIAGFLERARSHDGPLVLVDCTASEDVAAASPALLADGIAVVTANKLGSAGTLARWRELHANAAAGAAPYRHSATVGAGMPVLATVRRLRRRGERVRTLRAVLSGSLSAVLSAVQDGAAFSDAVADARARGCTERIRATTSRARTSRASC